VVSAANSLIGTTAGDEVGYGGLIALTNGNYVVVSSQWNNGTSGSHVGAATWGNGVTGIIGAVAANNSLIGTTPGDQIGSNSYVGNALSNGNYVVASPLWNNAAGAATWGDGTAGIVGTVSASNSVVGTTAGDRVSGGAYVTPLSNGNYVICSPDWNNGVASSHVGAATWGNGATGTVGAVTAANSLVGTTAGDLVGLYTAALSNGNYVVDSFHWNNGVANGLNGAVTWGNGASGISGAVSTGNSLVGAPGDYVGETGVIALGNGNYVVGSEVWNNGVANSRFGAATWGNGANAIFGGVSTSNSLVGTTPLDEVGGGYDRVVALADGNYVVPSRLWDNGTIADAGAVTLASGKFRLKGSIQAWNSVLGGVAGGGYNMGWAYDTNRHRLVVGRPAENIVSLFTMDQIFAGDFEP
jgi:hypothetical protein